MAKAAEPRKRAPAGYVGRHPERVSMELACLAGMSLDRVAGRFGVKRDALWKHMRDLDPAYRAALVSGVPLEEMAARAAQEGLTILDQLAVLRQQTMHAVITAKAENNHHAQAALTNSAVKLIHETARISGELRDVPTITNITTNVAVLMASPMMQRLQSMLVHRLAPFPDALAAVLEGLADLEGAETGPGAPPASAGRQIEGTAHAA